MFTTAADEGYVEPDWVRASALLVNVSLGDLTDKTFLDTAVVVDDLDLVADNPRRPLGRLMTTASSPAGDETERQIDATLSSLLTGRYAATGIAKPHFVPNPVGMGFLDVALYGAVAAQARHGGHRVHSSPRLSRTSVTLCAEDRRSMW